MLESEARALGVVDAIAGQTRMEFVFTGQANHAGTTPMGPLRHDALAAAAQWVVEVERYANGCAGLVATVGKVESSSGAGNVIAGRFTATLDVRHPQDEVRHAAVRHYIDCASCRRRSAWRYRGAHHFHRSARRAHGLRSVRTARRRSRPRHRQRARDPSPAAPATMP